MVVEVVVDVVGAELPTPPHPARAAAPIRRTAETRTFTFRRLRLLVRRATYRRIGARYLLGAVRHC